MLIFFAFLVMGCGYDSRESKTSTYVGWWFRVEYPTDFTARPTQPIRSFSLDGKTNQELIETDEAYFTSPDGAVEFYIYSPQWSGNPQYTTTSPDELVMDERTEELREEENPHQYGDTVIQLITIQAKDQSYTRLVESTREQIGKSELHHVFGIKYRDDTAYGAYQEAYQDFKASLRQSAD